MTVRSFVLMARDDSIRDAVFRRTGALREITVIATPEGHGRIRAYDVGGAPVARPCNLSARQMEVLRFVADDGLSGAEIAVKLGIAESSAKTHAAAVLRKLKVHTMTEAVLLAGRNGWLS